MESPSRNPLPAIAHASDSPANIPAAISAAGTFHRSWTCVSGSVAKAAEYDTVIALDYRGLPTEMKTSPQCRRCHRHDPLRTLVLWRLLSRLLGGLLGDGHNV